MNFNKPSLINFRIFGIALLLSFFLGLTNCKAQKLDLRLKAEKHDQWRAGKKLSDLGKWSNHSWDEKTKSSKIFIDSTSIMISYRAGKDTFRTIDLTHLIILNQSNMKSIRREIMEDQPELYLKVFDSYEDDGKPYYHDFSSTPWTMIHKDMTNLKLKGYTKDTEEVIELYCEGQELLLITYAYELTSDGENFLSKDIWSYYAIDNSEIETLLPKW